MPRDQSTAGTDLVPAGHREPTPSAEPNKRTLTDAGLAANQRLLSPVLYVGLNPEAGGEASVLGKENAAQGGVAAVTYTSGPLKEGAQSYDLSSKDDVRAYFAARGITDPRFDQLLLNEKNEMRDTVARVASAYLAAERGERRMERVVLSGHSDGQSYIWGEKEDAQLSFDTLVTLATLAPKAAAEVQHVMLTACQSAKPDIVDELQRMYPNVQTIWFYYGSSPSVASGSETHVRTWERQTAGEGIHHVNPKIATGYKADNVATWSAETKAIETQAPAADATSLHDHLVMANDLFNDYSDGKLEVTDPQHGPLFDYYDMLQKALALPKLADADKDLWSTRRDATLRLRFYHQVRVRFEQAYGTNLKLAYAKLSLPCPDFATLSRADALTAIAAYQAKAMGNTDPEIMEAMTYLLGLRDLDPKVIPSTWC